MTTLEIPQNLIYTKDHEWIRRDGADHIVLGITAHAVDQLGDITMVTPKRVGTQLRAQDVAGEIDSVKVAAQLFSPVSGEIVEVNAELHNAPEAVNQEPYGAGWMVKIRLSDPSELAGHLDAAAYASFLQES